jgi:hypothetical protein
MLEGRKHGLPIQGLTWQAFKLPTLKRQMWDPSKQTDAEYIRSLSDELSSDTEKYFPFVEVPWDDSKALSFQSDVDSIVSEMVWRWHTKNNPRSTDNCFDFNRECEFFPVCHGGAKLTNPKLYQTRAERKAKESK